MGVKVTAHQWTFVDSIIFSFFLHSYGLVVSLIGYFTFIHTFPSSVRLHLSVCNRDLSSNTSLTSHTSLSVAEDMLEKTALLESEIHTVDLLNKSLKNRLYFFGFIF